MLPGSHTWFPQSSYSSIPWDVCFSSFPPCSHPQHFLFTLVLSQWPRFILHWRHKSNWKRSSTGFPHQPLSAHPPASAPLCSAFSSTWADEFATFFQYRANSSTSVLGSISSHLFKKSELQQCSPVLLRSFFLLQLHHSHQGVNMLSFLPSCKKHSWPYFSHQLPPLFSAPLATGSLEELLYCYLSLSPSFSLRSAFLPPISPKLLLCTKPVTSKEINSMVCSQSLSHWTFQV